MWWSLLMNVDSSGDGHDGDNGDKLCQRWWGGELVRKMLPTKSVQIFNRHKRTLKRAQCTIVDLTTSFCIVYVQCAFTILTEKKRGNQMEIYAFSNYSSKSILQKYPLCIRGWEHVLWRHADLKTQHSNRLVPCQHSIFFHQCLEICSAVHMYWHWLAGWGDGERRVGVKTAGDSQKEPAVVALKWKRPQATDTS